MRTRRTSVTAALSALLVVGLSLDVAAESPAAPAASTPPPAAPGSGIQAAVDAFSSWANGAKAHAAASVVEIDSGTVLAAVDAHHPLNPASNTKVLTAAVVLDRLGPDFRFTTGIYGKIEDGVVPVLVLRGDGDPSLETADLVELARALGEQGVRKVQRIQVDQSAFDDEWVPPAFASQPNEWAPFRAPVSAVSLERNAVTLNVVPGKAGSAATAWFDPPGFVDVKGSVETRAKGATDGVRLTLVPDGPRLRAELGGFIGASGVRLRFGKRVDDPRLFAGFALAALLRKIGVDVQGDVTLGGANVHPRLAYVESEPLGVLVRELGKNSDNFFAETLLKALGAVVKGPPAKTSSGAAVVEEYVRALGAWDAGSQITNGSGLFDANRVSVAALSEVLRRAYQSTKIGPDFVSELAVGGVDGTLRNRFRSRADSRAIRAKTGTLDRVVALSGYVLAPPGKSPVAFSFIADGVAGKHAEARERIDRCVESIAATLWKR